MDAVLTRNSSLICGLLGACLLLGSSQGLAQSDNRPMTREQAQQAQMQRSLDLLNEALKRPDGETDEQRRQRVYDRGAQQERDFQSRRAQDEEYYQTRTKLLTSPDAAIDNGPISEYDRRREERLRAASGTATPAAEISNAGQRTAGFSQEALRESFPNSELSASTDTGYDDIDSYSRRDEVLKDAESEPAIKRHFCKCRNEDTLDISGFMCATIDHDNGNILAQYASGNYPYTSQCFADHYSFGKPGSDFTQ